MQTPVAVANSRGSRANRAAVTFLAASLAGRARAAACTVCVPGQDSAPGGGLDARYEQLRHAALHARAEAFPLGFAVLTRGGVTAWRHALADLTAVRPGTGAPASRPSGTHPAPPAGAHGPGGAELINALAAVALARAATGPAP